MNAADPSDPYAADRARMVDEQLAARGITDSEVLDVMRRVPRHLFVAPAHRDKAYGDGPLPIGHGQTISQPYMVAVMTQLLDLQPADRVLEVGTGSGYQTAVLARLAAHVVTIERHETLTKAARKQLSALNLPNVRLVTRDGSEGYPPGAPYDGIIVTAAAPEVPAALTGQLADGGRLICPAGSRKEQKLVKIERRGETFQTRKGVPCMFVPLIGVHGWNE